MATDESKLMVSGDEDANEAWPRRFDIGASGWDDVVARASAGSMDIHEVAKLAERLAASGANLAPRKNRAADLASTGGPTSLSTLLCPPMIVAAGWEVPKLGVPGRPAGGVDVLARIKGYDVSLDVAATERVLDACGYAHLDAGSAFAPADSSLFRYRQKVGAQAVVDLAIASLLSKKLAMSVHRVGLEIRVAPHGNFGADRGAALAAAARFRDAALLLGLDPVCILTDAGRPFQPYVGRGEALLAVRHLLDGDANPWLREHAADCAVMATVVTKAAASGVSAQGFASAFLANITAQGGTEQALRRRAAETEEAHRHVVTAPSSGHVEYSLGLVRAAVMAAQGDAVRSWPDAAGVILLARSGAFVERGQPLLSARSPPINWPAMRDALAASVRIVHLAEAPSSAILEIVGV